jgi:hypothetical protein
MTSEKALLLDLVRPVLSQRERAVADADRALKKLGARESLLKAYRAAEAELATARRALELVRAIDG